MSGVAGLFNVASTSEEFQTWSFVHAAHHRDINRIVYQLLGDVLPETVLDPFDPQDPEGWLQQHQLMHQQVDAILGVEGNNLINVDMRDHAQFSGWVFLNADEHFKIANLLGLG